MHGTKPGTVVLLEGLLVTDAGEGEEVAGCVAGAELTAEHIVTVSVTVTAHVALSDPNAELPAAATARTARAAIERSVRMF
jgi:hypothetical protein